MSQGTANAADSIRVAPHRSHCGQSYGSSEVHPEADYSYIACARRKAVSHIDLLNVTKRAKTRRSIPGPMSKSIEQEGAKSNKGQIGEFVEKVNGAFEYDIAENTRKNYICQWLRFSEWAKGKGIDALPADSVDIEKYLAERFDKQRHTPGTLYTVAAAIAFFHKVSGLENPCDTPKVRLFLKKANRRAGNLQRQAAALTAEALAKICETACKPRRGRGGNIENSKTAVLRGKLDIAMISLMRDALLRVSEAAALKWGDITALNDGTGRLLIRRSKTDIAGKGAVAFVSIQTMETLEVLRVGIKESGSVLD